MSSLPEVTVLTATSRTKNAFLNPTLHQDSYHQAIMEKKPHNSHGDLLFKLNFIFKTKSYAGVTKIVALLKTHIVSVTKQQLNTG